MLYDFHTHLTPVVLQELKEAEPLVTLSLEEFVTIFQILMEITKTHKVSTDFTCFLQHSQKSKSNQALLCVDTGSNLYDEHPLVLYKLLQLCANVPVAIDGLYPSGFQCSYSDMILDGLPTFKDLSMALQLSHLSPSIISSTSQFVDLYKINKERLFRLISKVLGHRNQQIEGLLSQRANDVQVCEQLVNHFKTDSSADIRSDKRAQEFVKYVDLRKVNQLLDFGGGNGDFVASLQEIAHLHKINPKLVVLDVKHWFSKSHQPKHSGVVYDFVDTLGLPYASESFDCITVLQVLHHLQQPWFTLKELVRVLKPGGTLFIREHDCQSLEDWLAINIEHFLYEMVVRSNPTFAGTYRAQYYSKEFLRKMLQEFDLEELRTEASTGQTKCYYTIWKKHSGYVRATQSSGKLSFSSPSL